MSKKAWFTVITFARLNTRRFFRDKLALFFTVIFPLIFLLIFGAMSRGGDLSFKIALINQSDTEFARQYVENAKGDKLFKINDDVTTLEQAQEKMKRSEIDATIVLPKEFGQVNDKQPTGQAKVIYTANNEQSAQTLLSVLEAQFKEINNQLVPTAEPFTVAGERSNERSLSRFDYTFAGLLGFSIIGLGIFGPVNVFPELKKQGILRRLHTTPLKVWQYFVSNVIAQAVVGLITLSVSFIVAILIFDLKVVGSYLDLAAFIVLSIISIYGIGLAIGGWAKNERQAAPLSNIVVFPMMFLSGTFFPRYAMPQWLQGISDYLPLTPVIDGIRLIATEGKGLTDVTSQLGLIAIWTVIIYIIAFRTFRWE
ncbi:MAG: ABC transporter permease [Candidatus Saccharibacteria bacterium]|nr:ABC transporter permease [Candidatus Saccharibacteria bacterium]